MLVSIQCYIKQYPGLECTCVAWKVIAMVILHIFKINRHNLRVKMTRLFLAIRLQNRWSHNWLQMSQPFLAAYFLRPVFQWQWGCMSGQQQDRGLRRPSTWPQTINWPVQSRTSSTVKCDCQRRPDPNRTRPGSTEDRNCHSGETENWFRSGVGGARSSGGEGRRRRRTRRERERER